MNALPTDASSGAAWIKSEREARGWSTTKLADLARAIAHREGATMALTQQTISGFEQGAAKRIPDWLRFVRQAFEEAASVGPERASELPIMHPLDGGEVVEIARLDLSLSMGPGALADDYVEEDRVKFDMGYLRALTRSPPARLRLARGIGDSMLPTLQSNDQVWIDTAQTNLAHADRIYAAAIDGGAAIKRLRPVDGGRRVMVISDNKTIDPYELDANKVVIWGRVIRFVRDL